jgi:NADH-quinone oxidoreductase subunit M
MSFASIGLPGLNGFVGEFLVLIGSFPALPSLTIIAAFGVILAAVYLLWAYERVFTGMPEREENKLLSDLSAREIAILAPLAVLVLVIGLYPKLLLDKITPSTEAVLDHVVEQTGFEVPEPGRVDDVYVAGEEG